MSIMGVDYAWGRPRPTVLIAGGYRFAIRYLSHDTTGKNLSAAEAGALRAAGLAIVSNWEYAAGAALNGYAQGAADARDAMAQHKACGGPADRPIYFSVDINATAAQLAGPVAAYFQGVASVLGVARTGAYGGYATVKYLLDHGLIRWAWQTYAWSAGVWDSRANLRQVRNGVAIDGVDCDIDQAMTTDYGQWPITTGAIDVNQSDPLDDKTVNAENRTVGNVLADAGKLRDWWIGADTTAHGPVPGNVAYPTAGSPAGKLLAFLANPGAVDTTGMAAEIATALAANPAFLDAIGIAVADNLAARLQA